MTNDFGEDFADRIKDANPNSDAIDAVGISWYRLETYDQCMAIFDDADLLHETFEEWREAAERTEQQVKAKGMKVVRVDIDPIEFPKWCAAEEFKTIDKHARAFYANVMAEKAGRKQRKR